MIIRFNEQFKLPASEVYSYFETPADWTRLYGLAGNSKDLGDGWYQIALKNFPFTSFRAPFHGAKFPGYLGNRVAQVAKARSSENVRGSTGSF